jgi:hypothetical protein
MARNIDFGEKIVAKQNYFYAKIKIGLKTESSPVFFISLVIFFLPIEMIPTYCNLLFPLLLKIPLFFA